MKTPAQQHTERKEIMPTTARSRELELLMQAVFGVSSRMK